MKTDEYGQTILDIDDVFAALYSGKTVTELTLDDVNVIEQFNSSVEQNADNLPKIKLYKKPDVSIVEFDKKNQTQWFMPKEYENFSMIEFLLDKTTNEEEYQRVVAELELFIQHNMMPLLNYLKYLVDTMRSNNIVWGVGRGSSVASYCLYLLGVHKVDSIKYELDIHEFLK